MNKNELILDRVRSVTAHDLSTSELLFRLTQVEDPSLACSAEGEEVVDALGSLITTLYRAKKATFSGSNSLISLDLLANQYGAKKELGTADAKIKTIASEIIEVKEGTTTVDLANTPSKALVYIYSLENGEIGKSFKAAAQVSATEFMIAAKKITVPTGFKGKLYVEYEYEVENAMRIVNSAEKFPEACSLVVDAIFRDKCNENTVYSGKIIISKAKINPESIELGLTSTGKHAFEFNIQKDYCDENGELFSIIVAE